MKSETGPRKRDTVRIWHRVYEIVKIGIMAPRSPLAFVFASALLIAAAYGAGTIGVPGLRAVVVGAAGLAVLYVLRVPRRTRFDDRSRTTDDRLTAHPHFRTFVNCFPDPLLIVSEGRVGIANSAARSLLGPQIEGQNVRTAFRHAGAIERLTDEEADHKGQPIELVGLGQADQQWQMQIRRLRDGEKVVLLSDRSATGAAEKMRTDFVANASHELMTPLAGLLGFIETLTDEEAGGDAETRTHFLSIMANEAGRMQALIRDLISLSRIEAEKYEAPRQSVDLCLLAEGVVAALDEGSNPRAHDIVLNYSETPEILADPVLIRQLLQNLLVNSMKYGRAGTPVRLNIGPTRSRTMASLVVEDEGEGIAPEHIPRLTERFYRVDSGRSRSLGGTGLGLSLVKHIVDRHRGHLSINSTPGVGTRITVLLPTAPGD